MKLQIWGSGVRIRSGAPPSVAAREFLPANFLLPGTGGSNSEATRVLKKNFGSQNGGSPPGIWTGHYAHAGAFPGTRLKTQPTKIPMVS